MDGGYETDHGEHYQDEPERIYNAAGSLFQLSRGLDCKPQRTMQSERHERQ